MSGTTINLNSVFFVNDNTGWTVGPDFATGVTSKIILKTINGGTNWNVQRLDTSRVAYIDVFFVNSQTGWIAGYYNNNGNYGYLLKTTNSGLSWSSQNIQQMQIILSIRFINESTGWIVGRGVQNDNAIMKSTNGGSTWTVQPTSNSMGHTLSSIFLLNSNTGWAVGTISTSPPAGLPFIVKTVNGGVNWISITISSDYHAELSSVSFLNENTGCAGGHRNAYYNGGVPAPRIYKTTNSGNNWVRQNLPNNQSPYIHYARSSFFTDLNNGWAVGDRRCIIHSSDGGNNWLYQISGLGTNVYLNDIFFRNSNTGWAVCNSGIIIKTTNGGITAIQPNSNEIPNQFSLSQNYPNPFNPNTKIKFQVVKLSDVKLVVFDALGRVVETLVNEQLKPGTYEVDFPSPSDDGNQLSSGVYYYKLLAGNFSETKQMILLK